MASFFLSSLIYANPAEELEKNRMMQDLDIIRHYFEMGYAPAEWKKEYMGWDLHATVSFYKSLILNASSINNKQFHQIVRDFAQTTKDYHVDVSFFSTESAQLPFTIRGAEGRYFIDWIDRACLPRSRYPIQKGDEVLEFGERPIAEVLRELLPTAGKLSAAQTDQALAEMKLTFRLGAHGDSVPQGGVMLKTRSTQGKISYYEMCWSYAPECVHGDGVWRHASRPLLAQKAGAISDLSMITPAHAMYAGLNCRYQSRLGNSQSFVPSLGEIVWLHNDEAEREDTFSWHAYIYRHPGGFLVGYIRIPSYEGRPHQVESFGKIIKIMEENTCALVIDQVDNPGGYLSFLYALASTLTPEPLKTPHHQLKLTSQLVFKAMEKLQNIAFNHAEESIEDSEEEPVDYQRKMFLKSYWEFIINEWDNGRTLTRPTPILGVNKITPHPKYTYTKPLLMLINELDFSGGDFMPAILQDNRRALLFGARTAGAGGGVMHFEFPNTHGIAICSYTHTIAERPNAQKIENLGVVPDIEYSLTAEDLQNGYLGYVSAVNRAIQAMLDKRCE